MATNFPSSADSFTNPSPSDSMATVSHADQHTDVNDAVEAIETALLDGAPLHIDDANERVGIGTASPADILHVSSNGNAQVLIESALTTNRSTLKFLTNGSDWEVGARGSAATPVNSFYIYDNDSSAYRMVIDTSGNVRMPYQPCFRAYHSADISYSSLSNPIPFNVTEYNIGNNYSTSTYLFTAPQDGIYLANAYLHWRGDSAFLYQFLRFRVNAAYVGIEHMRSGLKDYDVFGGQSILQLSKNDSLSVYWGANGIDAGYSRGNTNFNSFEVYCLG